MNFSRAGKKANCLLSEVNSTPARPDWKEADGKAFSKD